MKTLPKTTFLFLLICAGLSCQTMNVEEDKKGVVIDERDGQSYPWIKIGEQIWMAQNLNYIGVLSYTLHNDSAIYGRLYEYPEALIACPEGWHLPSDAEWAQLELFLGMNPDDLYEYRTRRYSGSVGHKLKDPSAWSSNFDTLITVGFNALPTGHYWPSQDKSWFIGSGTNFWTSTTAQNRYAYRRELYPDEAIQRADSYQTIAYCVRCVKN